MNPRFFLFGICIFALSGCSSLGSLLTFEDETPPVQIEAEVGPPPAAPTPAAPNEWCQRVAASDRARAQEAGFDAATLDRMTAQSYRQCLELGAR